MSRLCRFTFTDAADRNLIEQAIADALFAAECIHGTAKVRLGSGYYMARGRSECLIDTSTEVGEHIAQVFTGLISRKFGEDAFKVEKIRKEEPV